MAKIMTVDDSVSLRKLVASALQAAGHSVSEADSGASALSVAQTTTFDLVISDLNMPGMDGLTLVSHLRKLPTYRATPILILTTEMDPQKKQAAKAAGATGWLVKPFDPAQLLATIRKVLD
ncbi:MAG TPA: response regulator [Polyangiaceae bacterium]|nr:response regulator [Polyangiaceae bacterium]